MLSQSHLWGPRKVGLDGLQEDATAFLASIGAKYTGQAAQKVLEQPAAKDALAAITALTVSAAVQTVKEEVKSTIFPVLVVGLLIGYFVGRK